MPTYVWTIEADNFVGTVEGDTFDATDRSKFGGIDRFAGEDGNDTFLVDFGLANGSIVDGGSGFDSLNFEHGANLRQLTVINVESLSLGEGSLSINVDQLRDFQTITTTSEWPISFDLHGRMDRQVDFGSLVTQGKGITIGPFNRFSLQTGLNALGTSSSDWFFLTRLADVVNGGAADDIFEWNGGMSGGIDSIRGGEGNDTFILGFSKGVFDGGAGDDTFELNFESATIIGGSGVDTIIATSPGDIRIVGVERLITSGIAATISLLNGFSSIFHENAASSSIRIDLVDQGGRIDFSTKIKVGVAVDIDAFNPEITSPLWIKATTSADKILSGSGGDTLFGLAGNDSIRGQGGSDKIDGGIGSDQMFGGTGNDIYFVDSVRDKVSEADGDGVDKVFSSVSYSLAIGIENLALVGTASINGVGNASNNVVVGNAGSNALRSLDGDDILNGGAGNDTLIGASGNDMLIGGLGRDTLAGGTGFDVFRLEAPLTVANADVIADFNVPQDTIQLDNLFMKELGVKLGTLDATMFWKSAAGVAHDANDRIIYDTDGGQLYYDANGNAAGGAVFIAMLKPGLAITAADFVVI